MRFKQGQKSIRDGHRSGCRKIISGKLVTHDALRKTVSRIISKYDETWCQAILQRWVDHLQKRVRENGKYFENLEILVLCAAAYRYYDTTLIEHRHNVYVMACSR